MDNDYTAGSTKQAENIKYKQTQRGHKHLGITNSWMFLDLESL